MAFQIIDQNDRSGEYALSHLPEVNFFFIRVKLIEILSASGFSESDQDPQCNGLILRAEKIRSVFNSTVRNAILPHMAVHTKIYDEISIISENNLCICIDRKTSII